MKKEDLETLPPAVSLMIKDVMHRCRESPPSNWPVHTYELIDRQDLAVLDKHLKPSTRLQYIDGETRDYGMKDEQDDGMEFDDMVYDYAISCVSSTCIHRNNALQNYLYTFIGYRFFFTMLLTWALFHSIDTKVTI